MKDRDFNGAHAVLYAQMAAREILLRRQRMRPRFQLSKTRQSPEGDLAFEVGLKVGYWPCLKGPFISLALGYRRIDLWFGLPSNWPKGKAQPA